MTNDTERKPFPLVTVVVLAVLGLLTVYVLSPVPIFIISQKVFNLTGYDASPVVDAFYIPISYICAKVPAIQPFFDWQLEAAGLI